jgi:hypothetical protein
VFGSAKGATDQGFDLLVLEKFALGGFAPLHDDL